MVDGVRPDEPSTIGAAIALSGLPSPSIGRARRRSASRRYTCR